MKTIRHTNTLFYYDGPQVFEALDSIGGHYIAVMIEANYQEEEQFLVAGVDPERVRQFRAGLMDLRTLLTERDISDWYLGEFESKNIFLLNLVKQDNSLIESDFLPEPGFLLHDRHAEGGALMEAHMRNNLVLEISLEPPEAANEHRIHVDTLAGVLTQMQSIVRHAYAAAIRTLDTAVKRTIERTNADRLDVVIPAASGSFRIVLEATARPDLFGQSELSRALMRIDELFEKSTDPQQTLEVVKRHRGHVAGAYVNLLQFLVQHGTGLCYSWAQPNSEKIFHRSISQAEVGPVVDALLKVNDLGSEIITVIGVLEKADVKNGKWRIGSSDENYAGGVKNGGPSLAGMIIGHAYEFICIEEIGEVESTGREKRSLYLTDYK